MAHQYPGPMAASYELEGDIHCNTLWHINHFVEVQHVCLHQMLASDCVHHVDLQAIIIIKYLGVYIDMAGL
jgi:hypothetical protein